MAFIDDEDWVAGILPTQTLVEEGPPPVYQWDIPQTIKQLAYLTHSHFRYYGKFPPTIPRKLLRDYRPAQGTWVLDNFAGCGTTLVEAKCEGLPSIGVDTSALGMLAADVKTTHLNLDATRAAAIDLDALLLAGGTGCAPDLLPVQRDLDKWFELESADQLRALKGGLMLMDEGPIRRFLTVAFLAIVRRCSRAFDGEVRPHINRTKRRRDVFDAFRKKVRDMLEAAAAFQRESRSEVPAIALTGDARSLLALADWDDHPVGMLISHPPYLNCFDYAPVFRLEYAWANGMSEASPTEGYAGVRRDEIRCWPATDERVYSGYFDGLRSAFEAAAGVLAPGTPCCVVLGDCTIKGKVVPVLDMFADIMAEVGFSLDRVFLRSTHYGTGKYSYSPKADYHGDAGKKRDGILMFTRK